MNRSLFRAGAVVQGLVLGAFLSVAVLMMLALEGGGAIFRYQGF